MKTLKLIRGKNETDQEFLNRYQEKAIELDYESYTVRTLSVEINYK